MAEVSGESPLTFENLHTVAAIIGLAVGNELRSLALGAFQEHPMTTAQAYSILYPYPKEPEQPQQFQSLYPSRLGGIAIAIGDPFVTVQRDKNNNLLVQRTKAGTLAASIGGHLSYISSETSIPTRCLVAEPLFQRGTDGNIINSSIANRIGVLSGLILGAKRWQPTTKLLPTIANRIGAKDQMVRKHLDKLVGAKLVERKTVQSNRLRINHYRIKPANDFSNPTQIIVNYLDIVRRFASSDPDVVNEGHEHMQRILGDRLRVPYLIHRSLVNSGHTGKKTGGRPKLHLVKAVA